MDMYGEKLNVLDTERSSIEIALFSFYDLRSDSRIFSKTPTGQIVTAIK